MLLTRLRKRFRKGPVSRDPSVSPTFPDVNKNNELGAMWLSHLNQMFAIQRGAVAKGNLMSDRDQELFSRPFPGSSQNIKITQIGWPAVAVLAMAMLCAAVCLWAYHNIQLPTKPTTPVAATAQPEIEIEPIDLRVKWWVESDGSAASSVEELK